MNQKPITKLGYNALHSEIKSLQKEYLSFNEIIERVKREGDLADNSTYLNAIESQDLISSKILRLSELFKNALIIDNAFEKSEKIIFNKPFTIFNTDTEKEETFTIVGEYESDPANYKISISSPLAKASLGKKEGDDIIVKLKNDQITYEVVKV
ncbi:hypothetical protein HOK00_10430 [bacterium]|jgi:transcription elongation factor GreA|nr:hypothetical protein [bacterium]